MYILCTVYILYTEDNSMLVCYSEHAKVYGGIISHEQNKMASYADNVWHFHTVINQLHKSEIRISKCELFKRGFENELSKRTPLKACSHLSLEEAGDVTFASCEAAVRTQMWALSQWQ